MIKILYHLHIMWYESKMINETLDSLHHAIKLLEYAKLSSDIKIDVKICLNHQTYIETPDEDNISELFNEFTQHPVLEDAVIISKTMDDEFYNIGDWRRENYGDEYNYYVWGESDSLVPEDYFINLAVLNEGVLGPHVVTYSQRKMWDRTWNEVEHDLLKFIPYDDFDKTTPEPLMAGHYISADQMNSFNRTFPAVVCKINQLKIDGNMTAFSRGIPQPILPNDLHFAREDYAIQIWLEYNNIPQYHFSSKLKGHNSNHPNKRRFTKSTRGEELYKYYEKQSIDAINNLLKTLS